MTTPAAALDVMRSFLGIAEDPDGSNLTPIGEEYGWNGVAWCDETVSVALTRIGVPTHFASCWFHIKALQASETGVWLGDGPPHPGDIAFYGSVGQDHVNMVEAVDGDYMTCVGGNERNAVRRSKRAIASAYGFGRPAYVDDGAQPEPLPEEPSAAAPPFPLPAGWYYGPRTGPDESVSGYYGHGDGLAIWQQQMANRGWRIAVDGRYGPQTQRIATAFQRDKGLEVDGLIGPETWGAAWTAPLT